MPSSHNESVHGSIDANFMAQLRMPERFKTGVSIGGDLRMMDRAPPALPVHSESI